MIDVRGDTKWGDPCTGSFASIGDGSEGSSDGHGVVGVTMGVGAGEKSRNPSPTGERPGLPMLGEDDVGSDVGIDMLDAKPGRDVGMQYPAIS